MNDQVEVACVQGSRSAICIVSNVEIDHIESSVRDGETDEIRFVVKLKKPVVIDLTATLNAKGPTRETPKIIPCGSCGGAGFKKDVDGDEDNCHYCDGSGVIRL